MLCGRRYCAGRNLNPFALMNIMFSLNIPKSDIVAFAHTIQVNLVGKAPKLPPGHGLD